MQVALIGRRNLRSICRHEEMACLGFACLSVERSVVHTMADPSLLKATIGYVPEALLKEGIGAFVDWFRAVFAGTQPAARSA